MPTLIDAAGTDPDAAAARASLARGGDVCDAARAALAAIERDASERAAPYVATLARHEALRPPAPMAIDPATLLRDTRPAPIAPPSPRLTLADQTRAALLAAFEDEPDAMRRGMAKAIAHGMTDAQLGKLRRMIKI